MTDKELKKLSKTELLEMCLMLREALDKATQDNAELQEKLNEAQETRAILEKILRLVGGENLEEVDGTAKKDGNGGRKGKDGNGNSKSDS